MEKGALSKDKRVEREESRFYMQLYLFYVITLSKSQSHWALVSCFLIKTENYTNLTDKVKVTNKWDDTCKSKYIINYKVLLKYMTLLQNHKCYIPLPVSKWSWVHLHRQVAIKNDSPFSLILVLKCHYSLLRVREVFLFSTSYENTKIWKGITNNH